MKALKLDKCERPFNKFRKSKKTPNGARKKTKTEKSSDKADVKVYLSPIMLLMAGAFAVCGMLYEFVCSFTAVILHEFAHAKAAKRLGYALNEIKIMPYGAALCGNADIRPKHEILIAAAGPCFNFVLALLFAALWWLFPESYAFTESFCKCNVYIGLFNMLPVYPLDGGRVTFALLAGRLGRKKAYTAMRVISVVMGAVSLGLFVVSAIYALNICFLTVGVFMVVSAFIPDARARYYALFALSNRSIRLNAPLEKRCYAVSCSAKLYELCKYLDPDRLTDFEAYDAESKRIGVLGEYDLIYSIEKLGYEATVERALSIKTQKA